jgi:hypothetical protein
MREIAHFSIDANCVQWSYSKKEHTMGISDDITKNADNAAKEFANKQRAKAAAKKKGNSP